MELYIGGNEFAFNAIYERYSPRIYGFLRKRLRDPQAANDVLQRSFLKLHQSKEQYDSTLPLSPWIFTITRTALADWIKESGREARKIEKFGVEPAQENTPLEIPVINLSSVPEPQRSAIELRYFEELPYEEIAKRLKTSPANVRQLVSRGMARLRKVIKPLGGDHEI